VRLDEREVAGLTCSDVMAALSDYVEGGIDAGLGRRIEAHVAACRQCEQFGAGFAALLQGLRRELGAPDPVDAEVLARLRLTLARAT